MKRSSAILFILLLTAYSEPASVVNKKTKSGQAAGKETYTKQPQQFKIFYEGHFSFVLYDSAGTFHFPGSPEYVAENNMYREYFLHLPDTSIPASIEWQKWN